MLEPGELITAVELPPLEFAARSTYRKVRDRASYAFALVSVAAALDRDGGTSATYGWRWVASRTKPWRASEPKRLCGAAGDAGHFRAAAAAELADATPLRDNAFKVELAKRTIDRRPRRADGRQRMSIERASRRCRAGELGWRRAAPRSAVRAQARADRRAGLAFDGPLKVRAPPVRRRGPAGRHGLRGARVQHDPQGSHRTLDTSAAERPGVVLVMTHENAPRMKPPPAFTDGAKAAAGDDLPVMQDDQIHWNGQPIALVLAETHEQADHAASLIRVPTRPSSARHFAPARRPDATRPAIRWGAAASRTETPKRRWPPRRTGSTSPTAPRGTTITRSSCTRSTLAWDGDELIVHDSTQGVQHTAWSLAALFGIRRTGARLVALRGRRVRRQIAVAAPDPRRRGGEDRGATGPVDAFARGRLPARRRAEPDRAAGGDRRPGRRALRRADPHRHDGEDRAQLPARAVHLPAHAASTRRPT